MLDLLCVDCSVLRVDAHLDGIVDDALDADEDATAHDCTGTLQQVCRLAALLRRKEASAAQGDWM